jgi:hypothetical protein
LRVLKIVKKEIAGIVRNLLSVYWVSLPYIQLMCGQRTALLSPSSAKHWYPFSTVPAAAVNPAVLPPSYPYRHDACAIAFFIFYDYIIEQAGDDCSYTGRLFMYSLKLGLIKEDCSKKG